jgi:hypothetical protein
VRRLLLAFTLLAVVVLGRSPARSADIVTASISGRIVATDGKTPIGGADVDARSPSGHYRATSGADGRYAIVGIAPDAYVLTVMAAHYETQTTRVVALPNGHAIATVRLTETPREIGRITARIERGGIQLGEPSDSFRIIGDQARGFPSASSSGLGSYTREAVQGAVAAVPGIQQDPFANVVLQGGRVQDTVFTYDAVPVPQALIAEPGGNVIGAQLPTTGVGYTTVTIGGLTTTSTQGLSGAIDQIPATGVYPAQTTLSFGQSIAPGGRAAEFQTRFATPDLRRRYAFDVRLGADQFQYGDGKTFYPAEAATYGLSLADRASWSAAGNVHFQAGARDDLAFVALVGQAAYDQYGTPFAGQTYGAFDGAATVFPGETSPNAPVTAASRIRGSYAVAKIEDLRTFSHSFARVQAYASVQGAQTVAPFFDDLSYPNGVVSYYGGQNSRLYGFGLDVRNLAGDHHELTYGAEVRSQASVLDQLVPTLDDRLTSAPVLNSYLGYLSERWTPSSRLVLTGTLRVTGTHVLRSDGHAYTVSAVDPHAGANFRFAPHLAILATYDHTTVAPLPLETERNNPTEPATFVALAPEAGDTLELGIEHDGPVRARLAYFAKAERNLIDVLPADFRSAVSAGQSPGGIGLPTNAGNLLVHGLELAVQTSRFSLTATYTRGFSSSASQFGYNDLNAPAVAAAHLFPLGYVPDSSASLSYRVQLGRVSIVPSLSYQTGYPYGNGTSVWVFDPASGKPVQVPNDNHVNPGFSYYFLRDPAQPFNALSNPYIGSLGTPEGRDPNTLRSTPQLLASVHVSVDLSKRVRLVLDIANLFGTAAPTQLQGNPYLIGPPGYSGGSPLYAAWYGQAFKGSYTLGNGVPTNDGRTAALPWTYGTGAYVPSSYPMARAIGLTLIQRL